MDPEENMLQSLAIRTMAKAKKKTPSIADATESLTYLRQLQEKMMQGATDAEARIKKRDKKKKQRG